MAVCHKITCDFILSTVASFPMHAFHTEYWVLTKYILHVNIIWQCFLLII